MINIVDYNHIIWDKNINNGRPTIKNTSYEASFIIEVFFTANSYQEGHALLLNKYKFTSSEIAEALNLFKYDSYLSKDFD